MRAIVGGHFRSDERGGMSHTRVCEVHKSAKTAILGFRQASDFQQLNIGTVIAITGDVQRALLMATAKQLTLIAQLDIENRSCASRQFCESAPTEHPGTGRRRGPHPCRKKWRCTRT